MRRLSVRDPQATDAASASAAGVDTATRVPLDVVTPLSGSGLSWRVRDALLVVDRHELVFALGQFAVVHNTRTQELTVLGGQQPATVDATHSHSQQVTSGKRVAASQSVAGVELGEITAMALCGKRQHVAICRTATTSSGGATVSIHTLKGTTTSATGHRQRGAKQKTLSLETAERFCCTTLSSDGKLVCCQSANASWTLVVWDWSRERQIAVSDVHCKVSRVRFNVIDMAQLSTSGGNQLKLWTLSEYTLKSFASFKSADETRGLRQRAASYVDHVWLPDDCLVALLDDGSVQLIINGELLQTVQALATGCHAHCVVTQNNGEPGVMVGGSHGALASLRLVTKVMKAGEKEMHLQRRMTVSNAHDIFSMGVDATGSTLVCCTGGFYGSYDLSNLCLLLGEAELITLNALASTPFVAQFLPNSLSCASRRPCFASVAKLPSEEDALLVWNQHDGHECFVAQLMEPHASPLSSDIHPSGAEIAVSFPTKVVIYFLLQDAVKVAFEVPAKHVSHLLYSPIGTHLIAAQSSARTVLVYRCYSRSQREPELIAVYQGVEHSVQCIAWSVSDRTFFYAEGGEHAEIRHCRLLVSDCGDVEEAVTVQSSAKPLKSDRVCVGFTSCRVQRDTHDYVLFAVEKEAPRAIGSVSTATASAPDTNSYLRAWLNGKLDQEALVTSSGVGLAIHHNVTAIATGPGKVLLLGTSRGLVLLLYWKQGRLNADGTRNVFVMTMQRHVDLHPAPIVGLAFSPSTRSLLSSDASGVVLVSSIRRGVDPHSDNSENQRRQLAMIMNGSHGGGGGISFDEDAYCGEHAQTFVSVCQPDEVAVYERSAVELRKLRLMDLEGEQQQAKLENEILNKQLSDQRRRLEEQLQSELRNHETQHERHETALRLEWESRLQSADSERDKQLSCLHEDAQLARDQYVASTDRLHADRERLQRQLVEATQSIEDLKLSAEERESELRAEYEGRLLALATSSQQERQQLREELDTARRQLREAMTQQDQDQLTQLTMLSSNVDSEKARAQEQLSQIQGKMAALHQEVKMLLAALNQKDHELYKLRDKQSRDAVEIASLKDQMRREREHAQQLAKEKSELVAAAHEQKEIRDNLQRLNNVHRSQIELLQKNLLPKERELEHMQHHLNQLHSVNQEIVVQANLSDRLRKESGARAKQNEEDVETTQSLLEHVRNSIVVLQDELGELVKQSAVQEKSAIVGEIMRIHKRMTRQMDILQARDGRVEEVSAELHRQNQFLLRNKQHLRHQAAISHKEKHKLVSALSFQNATLMNEINALRKQNKELDRLARKQLRDSGSERSTRLLEPDEPELDGRQLLMAPANTVLGASRPGSAAPTRMSSGVQQQQSTERRTSIRPKSAAARSSGAGAKR